MRRVAAVRRPIPREGPAQPAPRVPPGLSLAGPAQRAVGAAFTRLDRHRDAILRLWKGRYRELAGQEWTPWELELAPRALERLHGALTRRDFRGYALAVEDLTREFARDRVGVERLIAFLAGYHESAAQVLLRALRISPTSAQACLALLRIQHYTLWRVLAVYEPPGERRGGRRGRASRITPRELEIIRCIAEGMTSKAVAAKLGTSVKTVETHRQNIFRKLELGNAAQLVRYAIREGLVRP